ncbi:MAG: OmpH family outer membrane protein [Acidobacteria bacterium]|jgi:outer membrane protein|nr:OmpH family outer membrane protein [Acidobacteriota bacterium]
MKKTFTLIFTILILSVFVFPEVKIGIINAQDIIVKTKKGNEVQKKLEALQNDAQQKVETLQNQIKQLQKDLASPALNNDTREKKNRELEDKRISYNRMIQDAQKDIQEQSQKELMDLQREIMPLIQQIGQSKGYTLILDMASSGIAYFDKTIDITDEVVKAVDAKFPGK